MIMQLKNYEGVFAAYGERPFKGDFDFCAYCLCD